MKRKNSNQSEDQPDRRSTLFFWLTAIFVIVVWTANLLFMKGVTDRASYGDMFGAANALFSGLAFAGIITAIMLRRRDLELQRDELMLTRRELEGQKTQLALQNDTLKLQRFEGTFFSIASVVF